MERGVLSHYQDTLWSLYPSYLEIVEREFVRHIEAESLEAIGGRRERIAEEPLYSTIEGSVAHIKVTGFIRKRSGFYSIFYGGNVNSTESLILAVDEALNDPAIASIVLDIDSPGGTVSGVQEASDFIYSARGKKPIVVYSDGMLTSAAYWIASAADRIIAGETTVIGSIGVATMHFDLSEEDRKFGVKRTKITAGKYKQLASSEQPLSREGEAHLQYLVDSVYKVFVDSVARNRGASVEEVLSTMADGREFVGADALEAGLIDKIGNFSIAVNQISTEGKENQAMDLQKLKAEHPGLYSEVLAEGKQLAEGDVEKIKTEARNEGLQAERDRCLEILGAEADPGATLQAVKDGVPAAEAYKGFYKTLKAGGGGEAPKTEAERQLEALNGAAPEGAGSQQETEPEKETETTKVPDPKTATREEVDLYLASEAIRIQKKDGIDLIAAQEQAFRDNPELAKVAF